MTTGRGARSERRLTPNTAYPVGERPGANHEAEGDPGTRRTMIRRGAAPKPWRLRKENVAVECSCKRRC